MSLLLLFAGGSTNSAPVVDAGPTPLIGYVNVPLTLNGVVTDDGLPSGSLTIAWTKLSGTGVATFTSPSTAVTDVTCDTADTYVFQLSADDSLLSSTDTVTVLILDSIPNTDSSSPWLNFTWH